MKCEKEGKRGTSSEERSEIERGQPRRIATRRRISLPEERERERQSSLSYPVLVWCAPATTESQTSSVVQRYFGSLGYRPRA